ncbi:MAG: nuclear transport factor 2 family protein [Dehalococcoidia bacterium]
MVSTRGRMWLGLGVLIGVLMVGLAACGDDDSAESSDAPTVEEPSATGRELVEQYVTLLKERDIEGLRSFLSDAFIIQRADGSSATKEEYLGRLPEIRTYAIEDVTALQDGPVLTVRWSLIVDETIGGQTYRGDPAPRLSSFVWHEGRWCLASHANFNAPEASATPAAGG